jgi:hypothetical protein
MTSLPCSNAQDESSPSNLLGERNVLSGIHVVEARSKHGDRASCTKRRSMCRGVNPAGESTDDDESGSGHIS